MDVVYKKYGFIILITHQLKVYLPPVDDILNDFVTMATMTSYLKNFPGTACKTLSFEFSAKFPVRYKLQTFWPRSGHF